MAQKTFQKEGSQTKEISNFTSTYPRMSLRKIEDVIYNAIKDVRIRKGLSQKELAIKAGMKQPDISKIEEGKKNITTITLARIYSILDIKKIDLQP